MNRLPVTFLEKTITNPSCILWVGAVNSTGYGCFAVDGKSQLAHRVAWEAINGPISDGLTIDHLCRTRNCVNVAHMEVVTAAENLRRARRLEIGMECKRGHVMESAADWYQHPRGSRECRACRTAYQYKQHPTNDIRDWATSQGIPVSRSGRLSRAVLAAYEAALREAA